MSTTAIYLPISRQGNLTFLNQVILSSNRRVIPPGVVGTLRQLQNRYPNVVFEDGPVDKEIDMATGDVIKAAPFCKDYDTSLEVIR
mgnify:FL=1